MYLWASPSTRVRPSVCVRWFVPDSRSEIQINPNSKVLAQKTHTATQTTSALDLARSRLSFLSEFACIGNGNAYTMHTSLVLLDPAIE